MTCETWPVEYPCDVSGYDPELVTAATTASQSILWSMSGRRYGVCETTESYRQPCNSPCYVPWADDFGPGVEWRLLGGGVRRKCCAIQLAQAPVRSIEEVTVFGDVQDPDSYYLGRGILYRINDCWPCADDCDTPPVEVTYKYGIDVPVLGSLALGELTCELLRGWTGADCRLPSNAIAVTRQGVTVNLGSPEILFEQNRIGLPISDQFIQFANPMRLRARSTVHSPDMSRRVR
jgi:hypothetical protein